MSSCDRRSASIDSGEQTRLLFGVARECVPIEFHRRVERCLGQHFKKGRYLVTRELAEADMPYLLQNGRVEFVADGVECQTRDALL